MIKITTMQRRKEEIYTLLMGQRDRNSPLSMLDVFLIREIARIRCEPIVVVLKDRTEWHDPDEPEKIHRGGDLPAEIWTNGSKYWYKDGWKHRDGDEPAEIWSDGARMWYKDGKPHRDGDKPAEIWKDGTRIWYKDGVIHRAGGEPAIVCVASGHQYWYQNGVEILHIK